MQNKNILTYLNNFIALQIITHILSKLGKNKLITEDKVILFIYL